MQAVEWLICYAAMPICCDVSLKFMMGWPPNTNQVT